MTTMIFPAKAEPHPDAVVIPVPEKQDAVIENTFFWPDVEPITLRTLMRLENTVTPERLRHAALTAISEVNAELFEFRREQIAAGFTTLDAVPAERLDGQSEKHHHYLRAVSAITTATLYERYRGYDASAKGDRKADALDGTIDELWRDARWSISQLQDKPRCIIGHI
ncbi:head completion/stabilization protein [Pectobacterium carotovorum]|uniref:Head completion/stabilization protein n=1 Tax=Pectobacterium parvum TaxID=2778550 RepID=A0AAP9LAZ0_9GAMM|nr:MULTISPECIES: head completion/stabilization protein [Pectobacterium]MCH4995343.1 head completion/stabilization protein [Pectobacterium carotovorum]POE19253.1 head completion/stabilization protein [Pectobacterium odoriferum]QHQ22857.1 head completion/stabilization protein [Pectobacterium parvum]